MKLILLLALVGAASAAPLLKFKRQAIPPESSCGDRCTGTHTKFNFNVGTSYQYKWETENALETVGSEYGNTKVAQTATVTLTPESTCQFRMELSSVAISGVEVHSDWVADLTRNSLRFHFDDGVISSICPEANEPTWVINFKRSILSALQNSHTSTSQSRMQVDEWDVSGKCPTDYSYASAGGKSTFQRTKNLNSCVSPMESTRGVSYDVKSDFNSVPILSASQECTQEIEKQVFKTVSCTETFDYAPMGSEGSAGVKTKNTVKISAISEVGDQGAVSTAGPSKSLLFEATDMGLEQSSTAANDAKKTLENICKTDDIRSTQASLFASLVHSLRKMTEAEISALVTSSNSACELQKKFVQDAIPVCGSEMCVKYVVKTLKSNELNRSEKGAWFTSLAFVKKPTAQMIANVESLVDSDHTQGLLGITSMLHNFCKVNKDCTDNANFKNIVSKLKQKVTNCQTVVTDKAASHKLVAVIKAIGNIGHEASFIDPGKQCYDSLRQAGNAHEAVEIRLALLNAMRRMPCDKVRQAGLEGIYENQQEIIELRTEALMQRGRCYCSGFKESLENTYAQESSDQFGNFMYTYVKSKRSSSDPTRAGQTQFFGTINLDKRFSPDVTKSSMYMEAGKFDQARNLGIQNSKSVIFDGGVLPKSATGNLTVQLFGTSWNLLEVGLRQEGLSTLFNDLFGPEGYFTNAEAWEFGEKKGGLTNYKLQLSSYLRVFGNELTYGVYEEENQPTKKLLGLLNMEQMWKNMANGYEYKMNKNIMFLDCNHQVPSLSGLPLVLAVDGTAAVKVERSGKLDVTKLFRQPHEMQFKKSVTPSASIEISSMIAFEAAEARTGVKHVTRLHKSTSVESSLEFKDKLLKAKISLPKEKMEILDIQSDHFRLAAPTVFGSSGTKQGTCMGLGGVLGVDICSTITKPEAGQSKPYGIALTMEKTDKKLNSYELEVEWGPTGFPHRFLFNTPGSDVDREVRFQYTTPTDKSVRVELRTPAKELLAEGSVTPGQASSTADLKLTVDNRDEYTASATLTSLIDQARKPFGQQSEAYGYDLNVEANRPGAAPITMQGHLEGQANKGTRMVSPYFFLIREFGGATPPLEMDATITGLYEKPVEFKWMDDQDDHSTTISWTTPNCKGTHKTNLKFVNNPRGQNLEFGFDFDYKNLKTSKTYDLQYDLKQDTNVIDGGVDVVQTQKIESKSWPDAYRDTRFEMKYDQKNTHYMMKYDVKYGTKKTPFESLIELKDEGAKKWLTTKCKCMNFDGRFYADFERKSDTEYKSLVEVQSNQDKLTFNTDMTCKPHPVEYKYIVHSVVTPSTSKGAEDAYIFHKEASCDKKVCSYIAYTRRQGSGHTFYDAKLQITKESTRKYKLESHLKSDEISDLDLELTGTGDRGSNNYNGEATLKCHGDEYATVDLSVPWNPKEAGNKVLADVNWDMKDSPKHLKVQYNDKRTQTSMKYDLSLLSKLTANEYEYKGKAEFGPKIQVNTTFTKNKAELMKNGLIIEYMSMTDFQGDVSFQTFAPWPARHHTGTVVHRKREITSDRDLHFIGIDYHSKMELKCHTSNQRILLEAKYQQPDASTNNFELNAELGPYKMIKTMETVSKAKAIEDGGPPGRADHTIDAEQYELIEWAPNQKIESTTTFHMVMDHYTNGPSEIKFDKVTTTPFESMRRLKYGTDVKIMAKDKHAMGNFYVEHNDVKIFDADAMVKHGADPNDIEIELKFTTTGRLQEAKVHFKYDEEGRNGMKVDLGLDWNKENKLSAKYSHAETGGAGSRMLDFTAKVPSRSWDSQAKLETTYDQPKQTLNAEFALNVAEEKYEITMDLDGKAETGSAKITTPFAELQDAQLEIKKIAANKYELSTVQNGQEGIKLVGEVSLGDDERKLRLETQNTENPFAVVVENTQLQNKVRITLEVIEAPSSADEKIWGIDLMKSDDGSEYVVGDKHSAFFKLRVGNRYYERKQDYNSKTGDFEVSTRIHPSDNAEVKETLILLSNKVMEFGYDHTLTFKLDDPNLQSPIVLTVTGVVSRDDENKFTITATLDYTGQKNDMVTALLEHESNRKPSSYDKCPYCLSSKTDLSLEQPSSNLYQKIGFERKVDEPMKHALKHSYKDQAGQMKECELTFNVYKSFAQSRVFEAELKAPDHTYTVEGIIDKNRAGKAFVAYISAKTDDVDLAYIELAVDDTELPNADFEIRKTEKSDVLFHASLRSPDRNTVVLTLWHTEKGKRIDDIRATVQMISPYRVRYTVYCRPGVHREIQYGAEKGLEHLKKRTDMDADGLAMPQFITDIGDRTQPMYDSWAAEQRTLQDEVSPALKNIGEQLGDYGEMIKEITLAVVDVSEQAWDDLVKSVPTDKLSDSMDNAKEKMNEIGENLSELLEPAKDYWEQLKEAVEKATKKAKEMGKEADDYFKDSKIKEIAKEMWRGLAESEGAKQINEWMQQLGIGEGMDKDAVENMVKDTLQNWWKQAEEYLPEIKESNPEEGRYEAEMPMLYSADSIDGLLKKMRNWAGSLDAFKADMQDMAGYHYAEMLGAGQKGSEEDSKEDSDEAFLLF